MYISILYTYIQACINIFENQIFNISAQNTGKRKYKNMSIKKTAAKNILKKKKNKSLIEKIKTTIQKKKLIKIRIFRNYIRKTVWKENKIKLMGKEFLAKDHQNYFPLWEGIGHYYEPIFFFKGRILFKNGILISKSNKLKKNASQSEIDEIVNKLYKKIPSDSKEVLWTETMDKILLNKLFERLTENQKLFIEKKLSRSFLPVTGAHGDLKDEHFFKDKDNKYYIIDWEFFRPEGSIVTDILRLYSMRQIEKLKKKGIRISQYNPMFVLEYGIESPIDLSSIGGEIEIALLTMITNCCVTTGNMNRRLERFTQSMNSIMNNYSEIFK